MHGQSRPTGTQSPGKDMGTWGVGGWGGRASGRTQDKGPLISILDELVKR